MKYKKTIPSLRLLLFSPTSIIVCYSLPNSNMEKPAKNPTRLIRALTPQQGYFAERPTANGRGI